MTNINVVAIILLIVAAASATFLYGGIHIHRKQGRDTNILELAKSPYGPIWVYEKMGRRCMSFENPQHSTVTQTCILIHNPMRPAFLYYTMLLSALYVQPGPSNILMIGLGGGALALQLAHLLPKATIDIVEINPETLRLSKKFFLFREDKQIRVMIEDGFAYVEKAVSEHKQYDWIIFDAFDAEVGTTKSFPTTQFMHNIKSLLSAQGAISVNSLTASPVHRSTVELLLETFGKFYDLTSETGGNHVMIATKCALPSLEQVQHHAMSWDKKFGAIGVHTEKTLPKFKIPAALQAPAQQNIDN